MNSVLGVDPVACCYVVIMGGGARPALSFVWQKEDLSLKADFAGKTAIIHAILSTGRVDVVSAILFMFGAVQSRRRRFISYAVYELYVLCGGIAGCAGKRNNAVRYLCDSAVVIIVAANIVGIGMAN